MKNYVENLPKFPRKPDYRQPIRNTYKKRKTNFIMTIRKIVKKAILMLQKFEDVQKEEKK